MSYATVRFGRGSSPHVRGAPVRKVSINVSHGIIPACAGSTVMPTWTITKLGDHPRMCGEHISAKSFPVMSGGSSPHVRGARVRRNVGDVQRGIIPACAGSTIIRILNIMTFRDHPRMCGEHLATLDALVLSVGSSPHVRGAHRFLKVFSESCGIIPACAGSTKWDSYGINGWRDHPRMCGEHVDETTPDYSDVGSSPHVRGAQCVRQSTTPSPGIIPACAGSTTSEPTHCPISRDHPRMCGEHTSKIA